MSKDSVPVASTTDMVIPKGIRRNMTNWALGPSSNIQRPNQYQRYGCSQSNKWRPSEDEGTTFSQSPAWEMADERARALERTSGALSKRAEKQASSKHGRGNGNTGAYQYFR